MEQSNRILQLTNKTLPEFMNFINLNWKKNHVFVRDKKIFDFQHQIDENKYSFLLYKSDQNKIDSILGFIPVDVDSSCLWLAIWKSKNQSGAGLKLLKHLIRVKKPAFIGAISISTDAKKIYEILGWTIKSTKHYYLNLKINDLRKSLKINNSILYNKISTIRKSHIEWNKNIYPIKDFKYYNNRFSNHPSYKYEFIQIFNLSLILIGRSVMYLGRKVFRIVDCIGDLDNKKISSVLLDFMKNENIDLLEMIMFDSEKIKIDMFIKNIKKEIIPTYLSPLEYKNIQIDVGYKTIKDSRIRFFLGDSDQDRPN